MVEKQTGRGFHRSEKTAAGGLLSRGTVTAGHKSTAKEKIDSGEKKREQREKNYGLMVADVQGPTRKKMDSLKRGIAEGGTGGLPRASAKKSRLEKEKEHEGFAISEGRELLQGVVSAGVVTLR